MKFGMFSLVESADGDYRRNVDEVIEQAILAEELGYSSFWIAEHHSKYGIIGSPPVILAAIAQRTSTIRLGTSVACLPFSNPVRVAEDYALVDVLSNGRLDFAAGRGNQMPEYHMMMADRTESRDVFWEALDIVLDLWNTDGPISYHGKHFHFDNIESFPKPVQAQIPVWVAAVSPETFPLVVDRGLQVTTATVASSLPELEERTADAARALIAAGRHPDSIEFPLTVFAHIAPTVDQARETFQSAFWNMLQLIPKNPLGPATADRPALAADKERLASLNTPQSLMQDHLDRGQVLVGDPAAAREYVGYLEKAVGLRHFIMNMAIGGMPAEDVHRSMRLFADEVFPYFESVAPLPENFYPATAQVAG